MRTFPKTFADILTIRHRWPKIGDRLLRVSDDPATAASFTPHQLAREVYLWEGYMVAGAALIDEAQRRRHDRDLLLYPILFNYRHGLEAAMKWIIERYGRLADVSLEADSKDHNLCALWKKCKAILLAASTNGNEKQLEAVEQIVKDFHDLDKHAVALRYSKSKVGDTILLPDKPIDLENVQQVMKAVNNFFGGADGLLSKVESVRSF